MKLTIMELAEKGRLVIEARPPERRSRWDSPDQAEDVSVGWVPEEAARPDNATLASIFDTARRSSSSEDPATLVEIAQMSKFVDGNMAASTLDGWLYRYPLRELYDHGLMRTRKRIALRDVPVLTERGETEELALRQRLESVRALGDSAERLEELLVGESGLPKVRVIWTTADLFVSDINRFNARTKNASAGGITGDRKSVV